jgi:hypothetical protein
MRGGEREVGDFDRSPRACPASGRPRAAAAASPYEVLGGMRLLPTKLPPLLLGLLRLLARLFWKVLRDCMSPVSYPLLPWPGVDLGLLSGEL